MCPISGPVHAGARRRSINPNEETMGSTPSGRAKPMIGAALPQHLEIDRDGAAAARGSAVASS